MQCCSFHTGEHTNAVQGRQVSDKRLNPYSSALMRLSFRVSSLGLRPVFLSIFE